MLIIGAKGHAKEILDVIQSQKESFCFFDNVSTDLPDKLYGKYQILKTKEEVLNRFTKDNRFIIGVGNPGIRYELSALFKSWGGELVSAISANALIGLHQVNLGKGLNIMHNVLISNDVFIGDGSLINTASSIHHDVWMGQYCEISPGARILGGVKMGNFCFIGTGAIVLPKVQIGDHVTIGAGAVVTKDVESNSVLVGNPAKPKR